MPLECVGVNLYLFLPQGMREDRLKAAKVLGEHPGRGLSEMQYINENSLGLAK